MAGAVVGVRDRGFVGAQSGPGVLARGRPAGRRRVIGRAGTAPPLTTTRPADHRCHCGPINAGAPGGRWQASSVATTPLSTSARTRSDLQAPSTTRARIGGRAPNAPRQALPAQRSMRAQHVPTRLSSSPAVSHFAQLVVGQVPALQVLRLPCRAVPRWQHAGGCVPFNRSAGPRVWASGGRSLVDPYSGDLVSRGGRIFDLLGDRAGGQSPAIHRELLLNTVELVTGICPERPRDHETLPKAWPGSGAAESIGIDLFSAGMHPFRKVGRLAGHGRRPLCHP